VDTILTAVSQEPDWATLARSASPARGSSDDWAEQESRRSGRRRLARPRPRDDLDRPGRRRPRRSMPLCAARSPRRAAPRSSGPRESRWTATTRAARRTQGRGAGGAPRHPMDEVDLGITADQALSEVARCFSAASATAARSAGCTANPTAYQGARPFLGTSTSQARSLRRLQEVR